MLLPAAVAVEVVAAVEAAEAAAKLKPTLTVSEKLQRRPLLDRLLY
jgi:hypothetical protein